MDTDMTAAPFPDRETVADKFNGFGEADQAYLKLLMENPVQDENLLDGLGFWLHRTTESRFLNSLRLGQAGEWIGNQAPPRLQMRLMEIAKSSQHPAYLAFREGLLRSRGLEKAFPKA
jgi:hypothetical protein